MIPGRKQWSKHHFTETERAIWKKSLGVGGSNLPLPPKVSTFYSSELRNIAQQWHLQIELGLQIWRYAGNPESRSLVQSHDMHPNKQRTASRRSGSEGADARALHGRRLEMGHAVVQPKEQNPANHLSGSDARCSLRFSREALWPSITWSLANPEQRNRVTSPSKLLKPTYLWGDTCAKFEVAKVVCFCVFVCFCFWGLHLWHMEVLG